MALPLPLPVGPGGGILASMRAGNALSKENLENEAMRIENEYLPLKTKAESASKLAYANLVGPQFLAKLFGNENIFANFPEEKRKGAIQDLFRAGSQQPAQNYNAQIPVAEENANPFRNGLLGLLIDKFTGGQRGTPQVQAPINPSPSAPSNRKYYPVMSQPNLSSLDRQNISEMQPGESYVVQGNENATPVGNEIADQEYGAVNKATPEEVEQIARHGNTVPREPSTAENVANYRSIIKEGEILGTERGKSISDIGKEQLALASSGIIMDRLTGIIKNPTFSSMRSEIPFFQDKQLNYLSKLGTKEQQELIGDFISTAQAFKASTVNSFKGKALEKEFNLADKIKIDENDTMGVALGKLRSLQTLREIAETKNDVILELMSGTRHLNLGEATREANKMINYKTIEKQVNDTLAPSMTTMYKNGKKYNIPTDRVGAAKKAGYINAR
jgi:hypothetical protein